jgi:hypothetical protein
VVQVKNLKGVLLIKRLSLSFYGFFEVRINHMNNINLIILLVPFESCNARIPTHVKYKIYFIRKLNHTFNKLVYIGGASSSLLFQ